VEEFQKAPEIRMKDGVPSGKIEIGSPPKYFTEVNTVIEGILKLLPVHGVYFFAVVRRENVAVLAALVTVVGYMPLK